ncbi:MAG TPA: thioredoxin domain-containing protein [Thermoproteota archaeon]|nr:thioredoxin domain-containing protein [Thermoproteota archaeon]
MDEDSEIERIKAKKIGSLLNQTPTSSEEEGEDGVIDISDTDFVPKILHGAMPAVVDFWAAWCPPCNAMEPVFRRIASKYKGKMVFARLNTDENKLTARAHFVKSIPTMMVFSGGEEKGRVVGLASEVELETALIPYISG